MRKFILRLALIIGLIFSSIGVSIGSPTSASAGVGNPCTVSWYSDSGGYYAVFIACSSGSHYAFKAHISCGATSYGDGPWQTLAGPWYGSYARCPAGTHAVSASHTFSG